MELKTPNQGKGGAPQTIGPVLDTTIEAAAATVFQDKALGF